MFVANTLKILGGHFAATLITLLTIPVITRLFSPGEFGVLAIFAALVMAGSPLISLGYESVILLPRGHDRAVSVLLLNITITLLMSLFVLLIIIFGGDRVASLFGLSPSSYLTLIPLGLLLTALMRIFTFWSIRQNTFGRQARSRVIQALADRTIGITAGWQLASAGPIWLIAAQLVGQCCAVIILFPWRLLKMLALSKSRGRSVFRMPVLARRYRKFPIFAAGANFMQALTREIPVMMLAYFFSPLVVGFYALARRVVGQPLMMLGDSISAPFFRKASSLIHGNTDPAATTSNLLYYLLVTSLLPLIVLLVIADDIFPWMFGAEWAKAAIYAQLTACYFYMAFLFRPISVFFDLLERQELRFMFNSLLLAATFASLVAGSFLGSPERALTLFVLASSTLYAVTIGRLWLLAGGELMSLYRLVAKVLIKIAVPVALVLLAKFYFSDKTVILVTGILAICCFYYVFLLLSDEWLRKRVIGRLARA